jgi:hypothetical protein
MIDSILFWNQVALDASKVDFSTATPTDRMMPQQGGPTRNSRAMAIVHLAMYDAYAGVRNGSTYLHYEHGEKPTTNDLLVAQVAVATAATLTLIALFSQQKETFLKKNQAFVAMLNAHESKVQAGLVWGELVARRMLAARENDGSKVSDDAYVPSPLPGKHRPDPVNPGQAFLGPLWGQVKPFGINDLTQKVSGVCPPALDSARYAADFNEVMELGSDRSTQRTPAQTTIGLLWAYDGARWCGRSPFNTVLLKNKMPNCSQWSTSPWQIRAFKPGMKNTSITSGDPSWAFVKPMRAGDLQASVTVTPTPTAILTGCPWAHPAPTSPMPCPLRLISRLIPPVTPPLERQRCT